MREGSAPALLDLVRWQGRSLRGHYGGVVGLEHSLLAAGRVGVPVEFRAAALLALNAGARKQGFKTMIPAGDLTELEQFQHDVEKNARARLSGLRRHLEVAGHASGDTVLLGDAAVALQVYGSLAAVEERLWSAAVLSEGDTNDTFSPELLGAPPLEEQLAVATGSNAALLRGVSHEETVEEATWRVPARGALLALLAGRVGTPQADPSVPAWAYLGVALKAWQTTERVLDDAASVASRLGIEQQVSDGFAIILHIFPELRRVIREEPSGAHTWERRITVPLAARRLVGMSIGEER